MGNLLDSMTLVLFVLKVLGVIGISWWQVLAPTLIGWGFFIGIVLVCAFLGNLK